MQHRSLKLRKTFFLLPAAAAVALALAGCGGGGGAPLSTSAASLKGAAIDAPIAGATITITSGAPLVDGGTSIGTITANAQGGFSISVSLPSGSVPIFANAVAPNPVAGSASLALTSYLGPADALAAAGALDSSINLPDLDISPVTTAALAVYAATNHGNYAALTPAAYAITLSTYRNDILAIAAAVKAVGDDMCTPGAPISSTTDLALSIATQATLSSANAPSTTLATAASVLGGSCASVLPALQTAILADDRFGPELDLGDLIDANVQAVQPGTYSLQAVIAETPLPQSINTQSTQSGALPTVATVNPAEVFVDSAVTIDASGQVTSSDKAVSGTVLGNLLSLTIHDSQGRGYQLRAKVGSLPTVLSGGQQVYGVQGGGINTASSALTVFNADLVPVSGSGTAPAPAWNGFFAGTGYPMAMNPEDSSAQGCLSGTLPLRFNLSALFATGYASDDTMASMVECTAPTVGSETSSWTMTPPSRTNSFSEGDYSMPLVTLTQPPAAGGTVVWNEVTPTASPGATVTAPYVLEAPGVSLQTASNGTLLSGDAYYVLGSRSMTLSSSAANQGSAILNIQGDFLSQWSESSRNSSDGEHSMSQGDH